MIKLKLTRVAKKKDYTIGHLYVCNTTDQPQETYFRLCDTLEPTWRDLSHGARKVKGHTAIPEGSYPVAITYSPKFKSYLPLVLQVPGFEGIRIHAGNSAEDTEGCILLGENLKVGRVYNSQKYVLQLKEIMMKRLAGEAVRIEIS